MRPVGDNPDKLGVRFQQGISQAYNKLRQFKGKIKDLTYKVNTFSKNLFKKQHSLNKINPLILRNLKKSFLYRKNHCLLFLQKQKQHLHFICLRSDT